MDNNRGLSFLPLLASLNKQITLDTSQIETIDFRVNTTLKSDRVTEYFCSMHSLPVDYATTKRHSVKVSKAIWKHVLLPDYYTSENLV